MLQKDTLVLYQFCVLFELDIILYSMREWVDGQIWYVIFIECLIDSINILNFALIIIIFYWHSLVFLYSLISDTLYSMHSPIIPLFGIIFWLGLEFKFKKSLLLNGDSFEEDPLSNSTMFPKRYDLSLVLTSNCYYDGAFCNHSYCYMWKLKYGKD